MFDKPLLKVSRTSHNVALQKPHFGSAKLCLGFWFFSFCFVPHCCLLKKKWLFDFIVLKHSICVDLSSILFQNKFPT